MKAEQKSNADAQIDPVVQSVKEEGKKIRSLIRFVLLILCAVSLLAPHISGILIFVIAGFIIVLALAELLTEITRR